MEVDVQSNLVTIIPALDRAISLAAVPGAVKGSGYRPGVMKLRARGEFVPLDGTRRGFRIQGWPEPLPVTGESPSESGLVEIEAEVQEGRVLLNPRIQRRGGGP